MHSQTRHRHRGGRHRRPNGGSSSTYTNRNPNNRNQNSSDSRRRPATPPTFFQKVLRFLGFGPPRPDDRAPDRPTRAASSAPAAATVKTRTERPLRTPRPPVHHEVTSNRVYVGNLHYDASESDLLDLFNGVGEVRNAEVVYHKQNHRSKGYAFIEMAGLEQARRAVEELNDKEFMGRKLLVSGARSTGVDDTHRSSDYARPAPAPAESQPTPPSEPESITPSSANPGSTPA